MFKKLSLILNVVLAVILIAAIQRCSQEKKANTANVVAVNDTVRHYVNALGTVTAEKKALQLTNSQLKAVLKQDKELAALTKPFNQVKTITKYETITKYDTITIAYKDSVPYVFERSGQITDKWYNLRYKVTNRAITLDSVSFRNNTTLVIGTKRTWFLGKETMTADVTNSNPYIKVVDMQAIEVTKPNPWYKKWYVWFAVGVAGGFVLK